MHRPVLRGHLVALLAAGSLALTACAGDDGYDPQAQRSTSASSSASSPSGSSSPSESEQPAEPFSDSFSDAGSGWKTTDTDGFFSGYDDAYGGSYRVGTRRNSSYAAPAPASLEDVAPDGDVTIDVDATEGEDFSDLGAYGVTCWNQKTKDGAAEAGFLLYVDHEAAYIGLWGDFSGNYVELAKEDIGGALVGGQANHLTATCRQGTSDDGAEQAELALQVNGDEVVSATYEKTEANADWEVGNGVGLVTAGTGADVFYDNFRAVAAE